MQHKLSYDQCWQIKSKTIYVTTARLLKQVQNAVNMFPQTNLNVNFAKLFCGLIQYAFIVANGGHIGVTTGGYIGDFSGVTKKKGGTLSFNLREICCASEW